MTASPQLIGLTAGLVAAVLFASLSTNTVLALALFYLTPLPVLIAGIGWGIAAAQLAFMMATVLVSVFVGMTLGTVMGMKLAVIYVLSIGLPGLILSYLVHLRRPVAVEAPGGQAQTGTPAVEWYPPGKIIAWTAVMGGIIVAAAIGLAGGGEHYWRSVKILFEAYSSKVTLDPASIEHVTKMFGRFILPATLGMTWLLVILANVWLAAKSAAISGQLSRPWPAFANLEYPPMLTVAFLAASGLGMLPNQIGVMAMGFVGGAALAFLIMGLTVIHAVVPETPIKPIILAGVYMGTFVAGEIFVPILVLLGLGEPLFQLRRRALERSTPPDGMAGPNS